MFRFASALAVSAAAVIAATAPVFASDSLTLGRMIAADIGRDTNALSDHDYTAAAIIDAQSFDLPTFERIAHLRGNAQIAIDLGADGKLTGATIFTSSGRVQLDRCALDAVRASTYRAERIDGHPIAGRYLVNVAMDAAN